MLRTAEPLTRGHERFSQFAAKWICVVALGTTPLAAQILHATEPLPSFEVATIKPAGGATVPSTNSPSESRILNMTVRNLIELAYNIPWTVAANDRILGGPGWIDTDRYDIDGKIDDSLTNALQRMSREMQKQQTSLMMQSLLADRFKLKIHFESRELAVYALVIAKSGPRLAPTKAPPLAVDSQSTPAVGLVPASRAQDSQRGILVIYTGQIAQMNAKNANLDELVHWLAGYSEIGGRPVVNQTGLSGAYDFKLKWARQRLGISEQVVPEQGTLSNDSDAASLFTALPEQLGLRLQRSRASVEILVVDSVERPSGN
ncbi:MAG: TIGR03435 family protein [Acidobacteriaceae bacterium]